MYPGYGPGGLGGCTEPGGPTKFTTLPVCGALGSGATPAPGGRVSIPCDTSHVRSEAVSGPVGGGGSLRGGGVGGRGIGGIYVNEIGWVTVAGYACASHWA